LVLNHPCVDGNKRVGVAAAELFLAGNGQILGGTDDDLESLTFAVAQGTIEAEALAIWIRQRLIAEE
jgi:death-on-curing protein